MLLLYQAWQGDWTYKDLRTRTVPHTVFFGKPQPPSLCTEPWDSTQGQLMLLCRGVVPEIPLTQLPRTWWQGLMAQLVAGQREGLTQAWEQRGCIKHSCTLAEGPEP